MTKGKGFTGTPGRHSMKARGVDGGNVAELAEVRQGTYSVVSAAAACDRRLGTCTPLHVLVMLGKYRNAKTGTCMPAMDRIAADLGISRRTVQKHINKLIVCGYVVAIGRRRDNGGWSSNSYTLLFPAMPGAPQEGQDDGGGAPSQEQDKASSEALMAGASDASPDDAYPPADPVLDVNEEADPGGGMRHAVTQGGVTGRRNPCVTGRRNNNSPTLTIDSNSPFAEANARASETTAKDANTEPAAQVQHDARQVMRVVARTTRMHSAPRDPLVDMVRRLSRVTGIAEGLVTVDVLQWHTALEQAGYGSAHAQARLAALGKDLGHGGARVDVMAIMRARVDAAACERVAA